MTTATGKTITIDRQLLEHGDPAFVIELLLTQIGDADEATIIVKR